MKEIKVVPKKWANANHLHCNWRKWYKAVVTRKNRRKRKSFTQTEFKNFKTEQYEF